jgi:hypothetical protein
MWSTTSVALFSNAALAALCANEVPAVRLPCFADASELDALAEELLEHTIRTRSVVEVTRLGISQYEQGVRGSKRAYFEQAHALAPAHRGLVDRSGFSPVQRMLDALREVGIDADVMTEPGYGYYWAGNGKLRVGETPIHVDFAPQDSAGWAVGNSRFQLSWNLYLRNPDGEGHLRMWAKEWCEADDVHLVDGTYYYDEAVVSDVPHLDIPVVLGDVVLVNSRMFHAVTAANGRLAFGSFVSVFDDGRYRLWS